MYISCVRKSGNKILSYEVVDDNNIHMELSKVEVVELIKNKRISNATVQLYNGNYIVRVKDKAVGSERRSNIQQGIDNVIEYSGKKAVEQLDRLEKGMPLMIKTSDNVPYKQCIYCGIQEVQYREAYGFFDGSGLTGTFAFSKNFIINNETIKFKFNDNDADELAMLLNKINKNK